MGTHTFLQRFHAVPLQRLVDAGRPSLNLIYSAPNGSGLEARGRRDMFHGVGGNNLSIFQAFRHSERFQMIVDYRMDQNKVGPGYCWQRYSLISRNDVSNTSESSRQMVARDQAFRMSGQKRLHQGGGVDESLVDEEYLPSDNIPVMTDRVDKNPFRLVCLLEVM